MGTENLKPQSKLVVVTCYDATFARLCADAECFDYLLVGDSLGMVIAGESSTLSVTLDDMVFHTRAVARGLAFSKAKTKPLLMSDLPVGTYASADQAMESARRLTQAGAQIVKVEGPCYDVVARLRAEGFRVCAHIGLTPQSIQDYKVQGKSPEAAKQLHAQALALQGAGAEWIVLEMIPSSLAVEITNSLRIPTIGIGAGAGCSGQVLVLYDLLGLNKDFNPKFLKRFADTATVVEGALKDYAQSVRDQRFPDEAHSFS